MLIPGHSLNSAEKQRVTEKVTDVAMTPLVTRILLDFFRSGGSPV